MTELAEVVAIDDPSGVAEARRHAVRLARLIKFNKTAAGILAIAITEVAGNIVKHARSGKIAMRAIEMAGLAGLEVLALDKGPGITNIAECMRDGHSTAGSPGTGLGALQRLTSHFELYTRRGIGTIARFEAWPGDAPRRVPSVNQLEPGGISEPMPGEVVCGDDWVMTSWRDRHAVFVVDGLGHGPDAAFAARTAVAVAVECAQSSAPDIMDAVHDALRPTRGAAAAVAIIEPGKELCTFCGVGNISAGIRLGGVSRSMISHNGILGHKVKTIQAFSYPFPRMAVLIAHSDGLNSSWNLGDYPGLELRHPALIAAALARDHTRGRDDLTVVAVRNLKSPGA